MDDIIFPEIKDNATADDTRAWYMEIDRVLNEMMSRSRAMEEAAKEKAAKKK